MNCRLVEAFGGVELECAVHAQHVDGADFRHHVGSDQHHDLVQAFLRADRLRHHLAKPAQQHARTAERATHDVIPRTAHAAGALAPVPRNQAKERPGMWPAAASRYRPIANATCKPQASGRGGGGRRSLIAQAERSSASDKRWACDQSYQA